MAAPFFNSLPPGRLSPAEAQLRDALHRAAALASRLLPKTGVVPLQDWVEMRMPGEVILGVNAVGRVILAQIEGKVLKEDEAPKVPPPRVKGVSAAPPAPSVPASPQAKENFLNKLSPDRFAPEEERLRAAIVALLGKGPQLLAQVNSDPTVQPAIKAFIPPSVKLEDWIEMRIGEEVVIYDEAGGRMCKLATSGKEERRETFFATLPESDFSQEERDLRDALLNFLAHWQSQDLATLSHAGGDKGVQKARAALLPKEIPLREWIERRIGGEVELKQDAKGQFVIHVVGAARQEVATRFQRDFSKESNDVARERFFMSLPNDALMPKELQMRQAIIDFLNRWAAEKPDAPPPSLSDFGKEKDVPQMRAALLPKEVTLKEWIEQRIGAEVETRRNERGQIQIMLPEWVKAQESEEAAADVDTEEAKALRAAESKKQKDLFFDQLPADGFTPEEEELREAILAYLESWPNPDPPTLSSAGSDPKIRDARAAFLPKGGGPSLREWIDRRIGGEVETLQCEGSQVALGLRGELNPEAVARIGLGDSRKKKKAAAASNNQQAGGKGAPYPVGPIKPVGKSKALPQAGAKRAGGNEPGQGPPSKKRR